VTENNRTEEENRQSFVERLKESGSQKAANILTGRVLIVAVLLVIQIVWLGFLLFKLMEYSVWISILFTIISLLAVVYIINSNANPSVKLAWVVPIIEMPLFGGLLYLTFGTKQPLRRMRQALEKANQLTDAYAEEDADRMLRIREEDPHVAGQLQYLTDRHYPVYGNTTAQYYPVGESLFQAILEALRSAEHYIFLEYFIVQEGVMWNSILEILKEKAAAGVEVRFIYDDFGSLFKLPTHYDRKLEAMGIQTQVFNPFIPFLSVVMNNRDHRKILVVDGHTAFTGGINLADEYINVDSPFGHWKDTGVKLEGEAVWGLTLMFLNMWNAFRPTDTHLDKFRPHVWHRESFVGDGYVIPYADTPLDDEVLAENVYMNLINGATDYVYIMTPYLITDHEMTTALCLAAKRGVDVRIMTPGIPDKKTVYQLTRSHYPELLDNGVKIYEYTPGFVHAKCVVADDKAAIVGTINFDYRSLYLHFECGTFHYKNAVVRQVRDDFLTTQERCHQVTEYRTDRISLIKEVYYAMLRLFAPLM